MHLVHQLHQEGWQTPVKDGKFVLPKTGRGIQVTVSALRNQVRLLDEGFLEQAGRLSRVSLEAISNEAAQEARLQIQGQDSVPRDPQTPATSRG